MIQPKAAVLLGLIIPLLSTCGLARNRIVPGQSVGQIHLGETIDSVEHNLGKADKSDGAMGHFWNSWTSPAGDELTVFSVRTEKDVQAHVRQIRVTNPWFSTANGISTRSSSAQIRREFPQIRASGYYQNKSGRVDVYDDTKRGVAFEIARQSRRCVGVTVHRAGERAIQIFEPLGFVASESALKHSNSRYEPRA